MSNLFHDTTNMHESFLRRIKTILFLLTMNIVVPRVYSFLLRKFIVHYHFSSSHKRFRSTYKCLRFEQANIFEKQKVKSYSEAISL